MKDCEYFSELISRMIDDEISADERSEIEEHIAGCKECRALYEAFSSLSQNIGDGLEEVPEDLTENIMAGVRRSSMKAVNTRRTMIRKLVGAAAAVAALAVICFAIPSLTGTVSYSKSSASSVENAAAADNGVSDNARMTGAAPEASAENSYAADEATAFAADSIEEPSEAAGSTDAESSAMISFSLESMPESAAECLSPETFFLTDDDAYDYLTAMFAGCETVEELPAEEDCDAVIYLTGDDGTTLIVMECGGREYCAYKDDTGTVYVISEGEEYFTEGILQNIR